MKYALVITLLLLAALVSWDIVLRIDDSEQPRVVPPRTSAALDDLNAFRETFLQIVRYPKEEHHQPEHAPAIAAAGYKTVRGIADSRGRANNALQEAWDTIETIRSIHGDDGPETGFVFSVFFRSPGPLGGQFADVDVLLPILNEAWNIARVPSAPLGTSPTRKDGLCEFINGQLDQCVYVSKQMFEAGNLDGSQRYLDRMDAIMEIPWIETLHQTKDKRTGTLDLSHYVEAHGLAKARVLILAQQYSEAKAHLLAMGFPNSPDQDPRAEAAMLWMPLYEGWHLADSGGGHDQAFRIWTNRYIEHAERKSKSSPGSTGMDWKKKADKARARMENFGSSQ